MSLARFSRLCFLSVLTACVCAPAYAQEEETPKKLRSARDTDSTISLSIENDIFAGEDDNYTNGIRISYLAPENDVPDWIMYSAKKMPFFSRDGRMRWHLAAGQSMFTPSNILVAAPQPNERPYAGWLYGSVGLIADTGYRLDNLQLTLGIVGPGSGAAQAQDFVHHVIGSDDPQGWDYQLRNEPGIVLSYERKWRGLYEFSPFGYGVDVTPSVGGSVGNVYTHGSIGTVFRFGQDLPADYGPPLIQPNLPGSDFFVPTRDFSWYLFAGFEARAVARNIFLDGNTFTNSYSVDKYPFVGGAQAGLAFIFRDTRVAYTHIFRTKEYEGQPDNDAFGALTVSFRF